MEIINLTFAPNLKIVKKFFTLVFCSAVLTATIYSQNSLILNHDFETTNWQSIAWVSQTNTGSPIIVDQNQPFFVKDGITAHSGIYFAYIGGVQSPAGLYEGEIAQEFTTTIAGSSSLDFYVQHISSSADPGSEISVSIDGNTVWSINPHFITSTSIGYQIIHIETGHIEAGNHTISLHGYENPLGGDQPMKYVFDDFTFMTVETASINDEPNVGFKVITTPGNVQIQTATELNTNAIIELVDLSGKTITSVNTYFQNSYSLPVSSLNSGMYVVSLKTATDIFSRKLFINQ